MGIVLHQIAAATQASHKLAAVLEDPHVIEAIQAARRKRGMSDDTTGAEAFTGLWNWECRARPMPAERGIPKDSRYLAELDENHRALILEELAAEVLKAAGIDF